MSVAIRTFEVLRDQLDRGADVRSGMEALLDGASEERPHEDWQRLRALDWTAGASFIRRWLDGVIAKEPPPREADGLWIGLFTAIYEDGEARADVYVHGCAFHPVDGDWACRPIWKPMARYAHCDLLRDVHRIAYGAPERLGVDAEYPGVLGFVALAIAAWARASTGAVTVARDRRQLVVGFDEGDMIHVGEVDHGTFHRPRVEFPSLS